MVFQWRTIEHGDMILPKQCFESRDVFVMIVGCGESTHLGAVDGVDGRDWLDSGIPCASGLSWGCKREDLLCSPCVKDREGSILPRDRKTNHNTKQATDEASVQHRRNSRAQMQSPTPTPRGEEGPQHGGPQAMIPELPPGAKKSVVVQTTRVGLGVRGKGDGQGRPGGRRNRVITSLTFNLFACPSGGVPRSSKKVGISSSLPCHGGQELMAEIIAELAVRESIRKIPRDN